MADKDQNNVIEGEAVVKDSMTVDVPSHRKKNDLPELPESMQKVKTKSKLELNELADFVSADYGEEKPKQLSELRKVKHYVEEEWPEREEFKSTNAFGLPKKNPSAVLKQEWPPKEITQTLKDKNGNVITNAFDLPQKFTVSEPFAAPASDDEKGSAEEPWYPDESKPAYMEARDGDETNVFGVPKNWYERKQKELEEKKQREERTVPQLTEEEIEQIRVNAHQKGYDAGHRQEIDYFDNVVKQFAEPLSNLDNQIADSLVNFALDLTERLVHLGVDRSKTFILTAVNEAVAMLPVVEEGVTITVNQHDRDILAEAYSDEELAKRKWTVMVENTMNNGDLLVEAKDSSISQTLEQKIQELVTAFISANLQ